MIGVHSKHDHGSTCFHVLDDPNLAQKAQAIMRKTIGFIICAIWLSTPALSQASNLRLETADLVVSSSNGDLSDERLRELSNQAQETMNKILALWSVDSGIERFGKIRVIFDVPRRDVYSSLTTWTKEGGKLSRVVHVYGAKESPQMMAHKLTSAVFPQKDKLIRNVMGIVTEMQIGNSASFPMCGFANDDWVSALLAAKSYVPLSALGPEHESWGMRDRGGGRLSITDAARQHKAYAEAGSFGSYLLQVYGVNKIKQFNRLSHDRARPSQDVFGITIEELEANWIAALKASEKARESNVALTAKLIDRNPGQACAEAQNIATSRR